MSDWLPSVSCPSVISFSGSLGKMEPEFKGSNSNPGILCIFPQVRSQTHSWRNHEYFCLLTMFLGSYCSGWYTDVLIFRPLVNIRSHLLDYLILFSFTSIFEAGSPVGHLVFYLPTLATFFWGLILLTETNISSTSFSHTLTNHSIIKTHLTLNNLSHLWFLRV